MTIARPSTIQSSAEMQGTEERFISLAARGLVPMFNPQAKLFCYRLQRTDRGLVQEGLSHRYTMMTLMGLHRLKQGGGRSPIDIEPVLDGLIANLDWVDNVGDLGVLLWLCSVVSPERLSELESRLEVGTALARYRDARQGLTMELSWFLTGLSYWGLACPEKLPKLKDVAFKTYGLVKKNHGINFFGHLDRGGSIAGKLRGRLGSFADQVYPIYALTQFSKAYHDEEAAKLALDCALALCKAQGPLGQWWWHYNSASGQVAEGYPVFSVHQHAMGPMTLFALGDAVQHDFSPWIYKGLQWINSRNELAFDMEDASADLVWRCIFVSRLSSSSRYLKARFGRHSPSVQRDCRKDLKVLFECRPYELGWLLYAFASRFGSQQLKHSDRPAESDAVASVATPQNGR